jgi:hypothetical protein
MNVQHCIIRWVSGAQHLKSFSLYSLHAIQIFYLTQRLADSNTNCRLHVLVYSTKHKFWPGCSVAHVRKQLIVHSHGCGSHRSHTKTLEYCISSRIWSVMVISGFSKLSFFACKVYIPQATMCRLVYLFIKRLSS